MTLCLRSEAPSPFGARVPRRMANRLFASWDGAGSGVLYVDARTLYRNGNNMGVSFNLEGGATAVCEVAGCSLEIDEEIAFATYATYPWTVITTLNNGARYFMDSPAVRLSLRFTFTVAPARVVAARS